MQTLTYTYILIIALLAVLIYVRTVYEQIKKDRATEVSAKNLDDAHWFWQPVGEAVKPFGESERLEIVRSLTWYFERHEREHMSRAATLQSALNFIARQQTKPLDDAPEPAQRVARSVLQRWDGLSGPLDPPSRARCLHLIQQRLDTEQLSLLTGIKAE